MFPSPTKPRIAAAGRAQTEHPMKRAPLKILYVVEATLGGLRRHVVDLLLGLATSHGAELQLHLAYSLHRADSGFPAALQELRRRGVICFECDLHRSVRPWSDLLATIRIAKYVRANGIDIVHGHSAKGGYIARLAAKPFGAVRAVYTPNASPFRLSRSYHLLEVFAARMLTDAIIAVSDSEKQELLQNNIASPNLVTVIPSGIPDYDWKAARGEVSPPFGPEHPKIVTIGRISAQKAPLRFVAIAAETLLQWPTARFVWIGDGEMREEMEHEIRRLGLQDQILITGWMDDAMPWLAHGDVFLLVSGYESFGYATLEAMSAGLPCVASDVPGSRDLIVDGLTGYLVSHDAIEAYVQALGRLLRDSELREGMGEEGRKRWRANFHATQMVEQTFQAYWKLFGR